MTGALREEVFDAGECRLNVAAGLAGRPPLLCLHGVTRCWQDFLGTVPALSLRWQVQMADFRGHGASGRAEGRYQVADYCRDTVALVRRFEVPGVLFGHSLGALVACLVAAEAPEKVRALILEDPPFVTLGSAIAATPFQDYFSALHALIAAGPRALSELAKGLADVPAPVPGNRNPPRLGDVRDAAALRFHASCLRRLDPEALPPLIAGRWLDGLDWKRALARIACPALLLTGDPDFGGMVTREDAARIAGLLPDCTRVDIAGVGHHIHLMQAEKFLQLATAFLESLPD